jgi:shikimate dehydrogenase
MTISASTRVCGSIGQWPDGKQSTSPVMHNAAFAQTGADFRWLVFEPADIGAAMAAVRALSFAGVSITKPFKEQVIPFLDRLDPVAAEIGAVNLVHNDAGRLVGYNCDWIGAAGALGERCALAGKRVAVLGSGGAARAVVYGLVRKGSDVRVFSRSAERGRALAGSLGASYGGQLADVSGTRPEILVNATSIGTDLTSDVPVPDSVFETASTVMDIIVRPGQARFLARAHAAGAEVIDGVRMIVLQGAFAFELITGLTAPVQTMQDAVIGALAETAR